MNLSEYIQTIGDVAAGRLFNISPRVAKSYRLGERAPRRHRAQKIIDATGGKVDWAGIYASQPAEKVA